MINTKCLIRILGAIQTRSTRGGSLRYLTAFCLVIGLLMAAPTVLFGQQVQVEGQWHGPYDSPNSQNSIHAALTHTGWVVTWVSYQIGPDDQADMYAWNAYGTGPPYDPSTHDVIAFSIPPDHRDWGVAGPPGCREPVPSDPTECEWKDDRWRTNIFCSGHTFLSNWQLTFGRRGCVSHIHRFRWVLNLWSTVS